MNLSLILIIFLLGMTGCATRYVERSADYANRNPESIKTTDTIIEAVSDVVVFESSPELKSRPLSCLAVFPLTSNQSDIKGAVSIRNAMHAHLAPTGIRLIALQRVDSALKSDNAPKGELNTLVAQLIGCDNVMLGEVTEDTSRFYGVYSEVRAGARMKIIRASTGELLWQGNHTAVLRGGGVPFGMVSLAMNVIFAGLNLFGDQGVRVVHDLARRLVLSIPNLAYQNETLPITDSPILARVESHSPQTAYGLIASLESLTADQARLRLIEELKSNRWTDLRDKVLIAEALIRVDDGQPLGYYESALARLQLSEPGVALSNAQRAAILQPESADSQFLLGRIQLAMDQPQGAIAPLVKAVSLGGGKGIYLIALGTAYNQIGDYPRAAASFASVLARDADNGYALMHGAIAQVGVGANKEAVRMLRRSMIVGIARLDQPRANRALNILRAMDLAKLMPEGEIDVLESKIKSLKVS